MGFQEVAGSKFEVADIDVEASLIGDRKKDLASLVLRVFIEILSFFVIRYDDPIKIISNKKNH